MNKYIIKNNMSLTNPILNELLVDEINKLKDSLHLLENNLLKKYEISEFVIKNNSSKINDFDNKIDLMNKLFNTYKTSLRNVNSGNNLSKESYNDLMNKLSLNIKNSHMSIMSSFEDRLKNLEVKMNNKLQENSIKIDNFEKYIKNEYLNLSKKINDNYVKISNLKSELEKTKIRLLNTERLVSKFNLNNDEDEDEMVNSYQTNNSQFNSNSNNSPNNWIKVTKKYNNNRYRKRY
jgi:hypothetical protein